MCGRYVRRLELSIYAEHFDFLIETPTPAAYNIACTDLADVVRVQENRRRHAPVPWGFLPMWAKDARTRTINARAETIDQSRMFRSAFEKRRCLILADGIIEWQTIGKRKLPHLFTLNGDQPFAIAGIWNRTHIGETSVESCGIITTEANELFARIHDRMPVVLPQSAIAAWLDPDLEDAKALRKLLVPYPASEMTSIAISPKVNNARYKTADCLESTASAAASGGLFANLT
jgi:putative SOS response-associated peptidase YedK